MRRAAAQILEAVRGPEGQPPPTSRYSPVGDPSLQASTNAVASTAAVLPAGLSVVMHTLSTPVIHAAALASDFNAAGLGRDPSARVGNDYASLQPPPGDAAHDRVVLESGDGGGAAAVEWSVVRWLNELWRNWQPLLRKALTYAAYGFAIWFAFVCLLLALYRFVDPPTSNLMLLQRLQGQPVEQRWVSLSGISKNLIRAVVVAEDARFCEHWGIDLAAIRYAIENAGDGTPRGASTISMQTAKNLFLWPSKSYVRKLLEVPVTLAMELIWPKSRILEVYLNIAEWGPGVFGIGAAARHHFRVHPSQLGPGASALLAASLPNPIVRKAGRPGPRTRRKAGVVQARARLGSQYIGCIAR